MLPTLLQTRTEPGEGSSSPPPPPIQTTELPPHLASSPLTRTGALGPRLPGFRKGGKGLVLGGLLWQKEGNDGRVGPGLHPGASLALTSGPYHLPARFQALPQGGRNGKNVNRLCPGQLHTQAGECWAPQVAQNTAWVLPSSRGDPGQKGTSCDVGGHYCPCLPSREVGVWEESGPQCPRSMSRQRGLCGRSWPPRCCAVTVRRRWPGPASGRPSRRLGAPPARAHGSR